LRLLKIVTFVLSVALVPTKGGVALAQTTGLALDRFEPAPAGDRMFGVPSPYVAGDLTPHVMLLADYAHNPLVLRSTSGYQSLGSVVKHQFFLHLNAALALWNRVNVNIDLPAAVYQGGDSPAVGQGFASPASAQLGDVRAGLRARIFGEYDEPFQIAVGGYVWLPTGASDAYVGTGKVRGMPQLLLGGRADRFIWSAATGPEIEQDERFAGLQQGSMFAWGAGIGVLLLDSRHLELAVEGSGDVAFQHPIKQTTNAELLFDVRYRIIDDVEVGVGAGPGLAQGVGTPDFRGVAMVAYTPEMKKAPGDRDGDGVLDPDDACPDTPGVKSDDPKKNGCPENDRDKDGILDADDACPDEPGVADPDPKKNGCPVPKDRDGDGIPDAEDACPDVKGVHTEDPKTNGCPAPKDRDGDGIPDAEDACPDVKGVPTKDPKTNGCPLDTDGDGIPDDQDACPNEKGVPDPDPTKNGCPKAVRVNDQEIVILDQVQFDTGKATIKKVSDALLDEVADVIREHPEITRLEVQGHTDNRGTKAGNKTLSQQRAEAVMKALVFRKIEPARLVAKGYGQDAPIAENTTDAGRQKNRRVQFKIVEKRPKEKP
jgi:outer membrane protein OmpA-like peptidoglycan-associated protein